MPGGCFSLRLTIIPFRMNFLNKAFLLVAFFLCPMVAAAAEITGIEPPFWWTGMHNHELQLMVYGNDIAGSRVIIKYPGVRIKEVTAAESKNYLFVYLDIKASAKPGTMELVFTDGTNKTVLPYELKARDTKPGAMGFNTCDVLYLITPDRFANGDPSNDQLEGARANRERASGRHGGDIKGIINHLDYLQNLGITAIWLTRRADSPENHAVQSHIHPDRSIPTLAALLKV